MTRARYSGIAGFYAFHASPPTRHPHFHPPISTLRLTSVLTSSITFALPTKRIALRKGQLCRGILPWAQCRRLIMVSHTTVISFDDNVSHGSPVGRRPVTSQTPIKASRAATIASHDMCMSVGPNRSSHKHAGNRAAEPGLDLPGFNAIDPMTMVDPDLPAIDIVGCPCGQ